MKKKTQDIKSGRNRVVIYIPDELKAKLKGEAIEKHLTLSNHIFLLLVSRSEGNKTNG